MLRQFLFAGLTSAATFFLVTDAIAADSSKTTGTGLFGWVRGSYVFADPVHEWRHFGPPVFLDDFLEQDLGDGGLAEAKLGYRFDNDWDVAFGGQYANLSRGGDSFSPADMAIFDGSVRGWLRGKHWAVDSEFGYNTVFGSSDARLSFGLRYAKWDQRVNDTIDEQVKHVFSGVGPRVGLSLSTPLSDNLTLETGVNSALLFGEIKTTGISRWSCSTCETKKTMAFNLDGNIGLGWKMTDRTSAVLGWQAQWWDSVNVATSEAYGNGIGSGKSGHLMTGPYLELKF
jgi:hypothetical protein